jgi:iron complex outermembrane receptor protein
MDETMPVTLLRDNRNVLDVRQSNSSIITDAKNTSHSLFGQVNWFAPMQLELIAGGRYSAGTSRSIPASTVPGPGAGTLPLSARPTIATS